ncbi:MAG TPA: serine/threonine-protein kinase [Candidatus Angelobacter sp.]|nr:serine/threonine-protein kinase [Candidatus Angelobacter sp.]
MAWCKSCGSEVQLLARFCSSCGATLSGAGRPSSDAPTLASDEVTALSLSDPPARGDTPATAAPRSARSTKSSRFSSSGVLLDAGRFFPGSLLAERYRIVALLGRGGMGEVYRADDLTLGQPVALKFLPEEAAQDTALLERFRSEVRISRKVSHPNVCRVYDVGEVEGQTFFTMEYVDGEDLASLLRRIGRLPHDKAVDIARQLCAGLAAAHAKGVLHRDLKPANIMLDGRGQAVITDFGLASFSGQVQGAEVRSGTPAYMAPEQLAGKEVTERSDIYSLGLVLYEVFTGKKAFTAEDLGDLLRSRTTDAVSRPSSFVKDIDPLVERVILQCLESEPVKRPASALAVAGALPGGDPLAAALAAGETPSPQMVAAAGQMEGMKPKAALLCLAACVLGVIVAVALIGKNDAFSQMPLDMPPDVLTQKAKDIVSQLGYNPKSVDSATDFSYDSELQRWLEQNDKPRPQWHKILGQGPPVLRFIFRQSPRYMVPTDLQGQLTPGIVTSNDPPLVFSGMINLMLDTNGKLLYFQALPPQIDDTAASDRPMDWSPLFAAAGLDQSQFQATTPQWISLANSDERAAWTGKWPGSGRPLRVEAASWRGKPVFFEMIGPWTRPTRMRPPEQTSANKIAQTIGLILIVLILTGAAVLARRQYKKGKGDRIGASRLAVAIFLAQIAIWLCYGHFVPAFSGIGPLVLAVSTGLFFACVTWVLYMALEPFVRRLWPQTIISWTRLVSGRIRDPLVGRDVLFGMMLGLTWVMILGISLTLANVRFGGAPQVPSTDFLIGGRSALGAWLSQLPTAIQGTLVFFIMLVMLRILLRNRWAAAAGFTLFFTALRMLGSTQPTLDAVTAVLIYGIAAFSLVRFGLITLFVAVFVVNLMFNVPITLDFSHWYATAAISVPVAMLAIAAWAFYAALGGQKLIKDESN